MIYSISLSNCNNVDSLKAFFDNNNENKLCVINSTTNILKKINKAFKFKSVYDNNLSAYMILQYYKSFEYIVSSVFNIQLWKELIECWNYIDITHINYR